MKRIICKFCAILHVCALSVCLLVGCNGGISSNATTTVPNATTTAGDGASSGDAGTTVTVSPSDSAQSPQNTLTTATPEQGKAVITGLSVNGSALEGFGSDITSYTYYLPTGTTAVPQVTATQSAGTGTIKITQATSVNGTAKISLNNTTYSITFVVKRSEVDMLQNTYYQLKTAKKLNVAYFGGSVTSGFSYDSNYDAESSSWRALTTKWLKSQYPAATITETNAAIGGTGTLYGAYRAVEDLKLTNAAEKPDLVFIEFAINDHYDAKVNVTPAVYMESIIRTIYQYAPQADIVMVLTTDYNNKDSDYVTKMAHREVAEAYQIPCIDVGARLWKEIVQQNGGTIPTSSSAVWKKYFSDGVHPANAGYQKYAAYIQEYLAKLLGNKPSVPSGRVNAYMPSATLNTLPKAPYIDNFKGLTLTDSQLNVNGNGFVNSNKAGASFTITFTGTELKLWVYGKSTSENAAGCLRVRIDNGKTVKLSLVGNNHMVLPVASGLANTEHTVVVTLSPTDSTSSGVNLDFRYFLISGDAQMRGIAVIS